MSVELPPGYAQRMEAFERQLNLLANQQSLSEMRNAQLNIQNQKTLAKHERQIAELKGKRVEILKNCVFGGGKVLVKVGTKEAVFQVAKRFSIETAKQASKTTATKVIPVVSIIFGVGLAVHRIIKGYKESDNSQYVKAVGEVASGVLACFPGVGTAFSVGLDLSMTGHDVYKNLYPDSNDQDVANDEPTLQEAYHGLGIQQQNPSKNDVDMAYRNYAAALHPDRHGANPSQEQIEEYTVLSQFVNQCKEIIYRHRGWN